MFLLTQTAGDPWKTLMSSKPADVKIFPRTYVRSSLNQKTSRRFARGFMREASQTILKPGFQSEPCSLTILL